MIHAFRETRWCYLIDGEPVHYLGDQAHPGELLSDLLLQEQVVSQADWTQALRLSKLTGVLPGEHLVAHKKLTRDQLNTAFKERAQRITRNLMGMNFGSFAFHPLQEVRLALPFAPVEVLLLLLDFQRSLLAKTEDEELIKQAEPLYRLHLRPVEGRLPLIAQLPLTDKEMHVATRVIPAGWPLAELVALRELEERGLFRLVFALRAMGMVEFVESEGAVGKRNRAERMLYSGLAEMERRNDFEALHAHWSSSIDDIKRGYQRVLTELSRERFEAVMDDRLDELVTAVQEKAAKIWKRLSTHQGRLESRKTFVEQGQLTMASDLLLAQGEMALYKGDAPLARACYVRVVELDPGGRGGSENLNTAKKALQDPRLSEDAVAAQGVDMEALQRKLNALG